MCRDGNSASLSVRYLNGQLAALWENAVECIEYGGDVDFGAEDYEKHSIVRALAQFHFFGKRSPKTIVSPDDILFDASFENPELQFICNHEAVLYMTLQNGRFNLEYNKAAFADYQADPEYIKQVENLHMAFRLGFTRSILRGRDGNHARHTAPAVTLDLSSARLVMLDADVPLNGPSKAALSFYMHKYLEFLQSVGYDTLYDVPDFGGKVRTTIDYTLHQTPIDLDLLCAGVPVLSTSVQEVNGFLHRQWLNAASADQPEDPLEVCLAEVDTRWLENVDVDTNFYVRMSAPKITPLCPSELIITFDLEDIAVFTDQDPQPTQPEVYHGWKVAYVVDVKEDEDENASHIKLDFHTARFSGYFSQYPAEDPTSKLHTYFDRLVAFFSDDYLTILEHYRLNLVCSVYSEPSLVRRHSRSSISSVSSLADSPSLLDAGGSERSLRSRMEAWNEREQEMANSGLDHVFTISEQSINTTFTSMWMDDTQHHAGSLLRAWNRDSFHATYGPSKVRVLSNGKAILWINLLQGETPVVSRAGRNEDWATSIKQTLLSETVEDYQFAELSMAFEVGIAMRYESEMALDALWRDRLLRSQSYALSDSPSHVFKHIFLDLDNAKFLSMLSTLHNLGEGYLALNRVRNIVHHLGDYLHELARSGYHILYSVPVYKREDAVSFGLTDVTYQVVARNEVTSRGYALKRVFADTPAIVVLGTRSSQTLPVTDLDWSSNWIVNSSSDKILGMVCLSRGTFLEGPVLLALSKINAVTTIVPLYAGVVNGEWHCDLTTWDKHEYRKGDVCGWKLLPEVTSGYLEYEWQHRDDWTRQHGGTASGGQYRLSCVTRNVVRIPYGYQPNGLEFEVKGKSVVNISGQADRVWSSRSSASWSASIRVHSGECGIVVRASGNATPAFEGVEEEGHSIFNIEKLHAMHLPKVIDIETIIKDFKAVWEGVWTHSSAGSLSYALANPVFNRHGDLLVQVGMHGAKQIVYGDTRKRKPQIIPLRLSLRPASISLPSRGPDTPLSSPRPSYITSLNSPSRTPSLLVSPGSPGQWKRRDYTRRDQRRASRNLSLGGSIFTDDPDITSMQ